MSQCARPPSRTQTNPVPVSRIVGGTEVEYPRQYQWLVSLQYSSGSHFCGGTLIAPSWVMTAAHCTQGVVGQIQVGVHKQSTKDAGDAGCVQTRSVIQVINHASYNGGTLEHDISLLQLDRSIEQYRPIAALDAPGADQISDNAGEEMIIAGWGLTQENGNSADAARHARVPIVSQTQCRSAYGSEITDGMMCAGLTAGGRNGGPVPSLRRYMYYVA